MSEEGQPQPQAQNAQVFTGSGGADACAKPRKRLSKEERQRRAAQRRRQRLLARGDMGLKFIQKQVSKEQVEATEQKNLSAVAATAQREAITRDKRETAAKSSIDSDDSCQQLLADASSGVESWTQRVVDSEYFAHTVLCVAFGLTLSLAPWLNAFGYRLSFNGWSFFFTFEAILYALFSVIRGSTQTTKSGSIIDMLETAATMVPLPFQKFVKSLLLFAEWMKMASQMFSDLALILFVWALSELLIAPFICIR